MSSSTPYPTQREYHHHHHHHHHRLSENFSLITAGRGVF
jgi:hypothetical protein